MIKITLVATNVTSIWFRLYPRAIARLPKPPPPIAPAIVVNPIRLIIVTEETRIIEGNPSFKYTQKIISKGEEPIASAASITPGSTSNNAF